VQRLTATFAAGPPVRGALLALDLELREALDDVAFAAFRREYADRPVAARLDGTRFTVAGTLPLELDLGGPADRPRRVRFAPTLPADVLLLVNDRDVAGWDAARDD
jgi:hypothetical protein